MTSLRGPRLWILAALIVVGGLVLAGIAAKSLRQVGQAVTSSPQPCTPAPCSAPHGFEADISGVSSSNGLVRIQVRFKNRTKADAFEAVSYRHTSPADFQLRLADGHQVHPVFNSQCPDWPELHVARGADGGPEPLCFAGTASLKGAQLIWSPDLGLLFDDVQIPLD